MWDVNALHASDIGRNWTNVGLHGTVSLWCHQYDAIDITDCSSYDLIDPVKYVITVVQDLSLIHI